MPHTRKLKLVIFTDVPKEGGGARFITYLDKIFQSSTIYTVEFLFTCDFDGWKEKQLTAPLAYFDLGLHGPELFNRLARCQNAFRTYISNHTPDLIIFSNSCCIANIGPRKACADLGIPTLHIEHNCHPDLQDMPPKIWADLQHVYKAANHVVTVSNDCKTNLQTIYGCPADKITVIHNPVNDLFFHHSDTNTRTTYRAHLNIADDEILAVTSGQITGSKGVVPLMMMLAKNHAYLRTRKLKFVWLGGGDLLNLARKNAQDLEISDLIYFPGWVQDIHHFLDAADIYIHPSVNEAFGISIAEAMAKRLPVLAVNTGGVQEVVEDTGVLVENPPDTLEDQLINGLLVLMYDLQGYAEKGNIRAKQNFRFDQFERKFMNVMEIFSKQTAQ